MDPYVEACGLWADFHSALIAEIQRALSEVLPRGYVARTGTRSYLVLAEAEEKIERQFEPDVSVTAPRARPTDATKAKHGGTAAATAGPEPLSLRAFVETEFVEKFLDVYELQPERRLVTSIEVLSPSNKRRRSPGWKKYLRKRQALLLGKANLVEIDLLRGGTRMPMLDPLPGSPYYLLVSREESAPRCQVWPAYFDRPLPALPVPLAQPEADLTLALQPLVEAIYKRSRYGEDIDYARPLAPPLTAEEAAWLAKRLRGDAPPAEGPRPRRRPPRR
jgi:hypothetical protein